jgi:hypothetical protein
MVAKKQTTIIPNTDEISLNQLPIVQDSNYDDEKTDEDILNDVLSELGGSSDAKVNVYQIEVGKSPAFVGSYAPDMFSIDSIQQTYGAGEYQIHVRSGGRLRSRRTVRIAKPKVDPNSTVQNAPNTEAIIQTMQQGFASMLEGLKVVVQSQPHQPVKTTQDLLQELMLMKQIMGGDNKGGAGIDDFLKMLEVAKGMVSSSEPAGTNDILMEGIKSIAPMLAAGFAQQQQQPQLSQIQRINYPPKLAPDVLPNPAPVIPVQTPAPIATQEQPPTLNLNQSEIDAMKLQEMMLFNLLISNAEKDNDPEPYANMLLDIVGDDEAEKMLNVPNWFELLVERDSRVQNYQAWFINLRAIMLDYINESKNDLTAQNPSDINDANTVNAQSSDDATKQTNPAP